MQHETSYAGTLTNISTRIGLWFGSLLVAVPLFNLLLSLVFSRGHFQLELLFAVFRLTMMFAFPVWCLYIPFVIAIKDAERWRLWTILVSGILIGPTSLGVWGLILQLRGGDPREIWYGDPLLGIGLRLMMICALIVGSLTTSFYVLALRRRYRRPSTAAQGRVWRGAI